MGKNPYYDDSDEVECDLCGQVKYLSRDRLWGLDDTVEDPETGETVGVNLICDDCHREIFRR